MSDEITYCDHGYSEPETGCFACCEAKLKIAVEAMNSILDKKRIYDCRVLLSYPEQNAGVYDIQYIVRVALDKIEKAQKAGAE